MLAQLDETAPVVMPDAVAAKRLRGLALARAAVVAVAILVISSCDDGNSGPGLIRQINFIANPCNGTTQLAVAQATRIDCSNGGNTVTLAGNGASYLVVTQFPAEEGSNVFIPYSLATGTLITNDAVRSAVRARNIRATPRAGRGAHSRIAQMSYDRAMRARGRSRSASVAAAANRRAQGQRRRSVVAPPALGSVRSFHVSSTSVTATTATWATVAAKLAYVGNNVLLYIDTLAPANGFAPAQIPAFGQYFDQTLYPLDTMAFGSPSDIDNNGRAIMVMSPVVNADTPTSICVSEGYVAGFFDPTDFDGASDPNSNQGEIFYSIVPDPAGAFSCAHPAGDVTGAVPSTFMHELQHLIDYSQHVVILGGDPEASWLDEGLSINAEEIGALYWNSQCPPPACRTDPSQLFPDTAQGFVSNFLYDSYQYAFLPDTASLTLHSDSDDGFSWRGGDWALLHYLSDQFGQSVFRKLETGPADGIANIAAATGVAFPVLFANFGLALYTDSLPGLPRNTALQVNRFTTENLRKMWAREFQTDGPAPDLPVASPILLFPISADTSSSVMAPGTMSFWRLDTPGSAATVTIRFSAPGGAAFAAPLQPQLAIFRLPPGQ